MTAVRNLVHQNVGKSGNVKNEKYVQLSDPLVDILETRSQ